MGILVVHVAQFLQTLFGVVCIKLLRVGGVEQHSHRDVVRDWWERRCHFGSSGSSMAPKSSLDCSLREGGNSVSGPTTALIPSILSCRVPNCYAGFHLQSFSSVVSFPFFFLLATALGLVIHTSYPGSLFHRYQNCLAPKDEYAQDISEEGTN